MHNCVASLTPPQQFDMNNLNTIKEDYKKLGNPYYEPLSWFMISQSHDILMLYNTTTISCIFIPAYHEFMHKASKQTNC